MLWEQARIIVNPIAGAAKATSREWPHIRSLLRNGGLSFDYRYTNGPGHAMELTREAVGKGCCLVVAVGGDGTIHEVANGLLDSPDHSVQMGIIGTGTGNDFIRSMGIPHDYVEACHRVTSGHPSVIDVGLVEYTANGRRQRRYFVNGAGVGFDAEVISNSRKIPRLFNDTVPFVLSLLRTLPFYRNRKMLIDIDGRQEERRAMSVVVTNGAYFGGGMHIAPQAQLSDRLMDVVTIGDVGKVELLHVFPRVYKGTHVTHPKVRMDRAERVSVSSDRRLFLQADGELLGECPVTFEVAPAALTIVV
ncbi:MAG: diacylglycerol kinase family lipid kinase [Dehalococcoidia bacterium]|nr:diacylglycerol kinase family lipid kinase [Dehalococcoidia bacterium]